MWVVLDALSYTHTHIHTYIHCICQLIDTYIKNCIAIAKIHELISCLCVVPQPQPHAPRCAARTDRCPQAGAIAASEGVSGIVLHARTAMQQYSPPADWGAIARLVAALPGVPIIGNGDVFEAADALRMMRETGCAGERALPPHT
jgi:Dihydrouridine synthase (Dus)